MSAPNQNAVAPKRRLRITLHHPPATAEAVSEVFFRLGAQAIWEDQPDQAGYLVSRAGFEAEQAETLRPPLIAGLARIAEIFETGPLEPVFEIETDANWAEKWKEGLRPIIIHNTLAIKPTWWAEPLDGQPPLVLELDPGLAFGTGHHATTYLCLTALLELLKEKTGRILDLGSGSGILALSAALLTAGQHPRPEIIGLDNDPETIPVARANAALNNLEERVTFGLDPGVLDGPPFDLILANITMNPLLALKEAVARAAAAESALVLSGLLSGQVPEVASAYQALGFQLQKFLRREEWAALVFKKTLNVSARPDSAVTEAWV